MSGVLHAAAEARFVLDAPLLHLRHELGDQLASCHQVVLLHRVERQRPRSSRALGKRGCSWRGRTTLDLGAIPVQVQVGKESKDCRRSLGPHTGTGRAAVRRRESLEVGILHGQGVLLGGSAVDQGVGTDRL
eukprot:2602624-Rhodomonas_salina.1